LAPSSASSLKKDTRRFGIARSFGEVFEEPACGSRGSGITFDKFHVVAHASAALDQTRRIEQRRDPSLKGVRWTLLKDRQRLLPKRAPTSMP
jgi:hypothetical protein